MEPQKKKKEEEKKKIEEEKEKKKKKKKKKKEEKEKIVIMLWTGRLMKSIIDFRHEERTFFFSKMSRVLEVLSL